MSVATFAYLIPSPIKTVWPMVSVALLTLYPHAPIGEIPGLYRSSVTLLDYRFPAGLAAQLHQQTENLTRLDVHVALPFILNDPRNADTAHEVYRALATLVQFNQQRPP